MTKEICEIVVSDGPLVPPPLQFTADAGGVVEFHGVVRGHEGDAPISGIAYEAHVEMARHQLVALANEAAARFPILALCVHHRIGFVPVAEPSLFLRVSAAHRGPAFAAAEWMIDQLKQRIPIWKHAAPKGPALVSSPGARQSIAPAGCVLVAG